MIRNLTGMLALGLGLLVLEGASSALGQDNGKWGTVKGQLVYGGAVIPEPEKLKVDKDVGHCLSRGDIYSEAWVINKKNKGVKNVFVWLESANGQPLPIHPQRKPIPQKEAEIDQPCCMFVPHALAIREGQTIVVKNPSPVTHNFKWGGHPEVNPGGNNNMPPNSQFKITDLKADRLPVRIECNIHPWMGGYIRVFDHPYFAITDDNGNFSLSLAPAGEYRIKIWHPSVGWRTGPPGKKGEPIQIKADSITDLGQLPIGGK